MSTCSGAAGQTWTVESDGTLRSMGRCLDVTDGAIEDGSPVQLFSCDGSGEQQWVYTDDRTWLNPQSDKCLDVTDRDEDDGAPMQIWTCFAGANQRWSRPGA
jgi:hypothetical protein